MMLVNMAILLVFNVPLTKILLELMFHKKQVFLKHILITGGTGFIGSHAVIAFEQAGYSTVVVDNLCNSSTDVLEGIKKIL